MCVVFRITMVLLLIVTTNSLPFGRFVVFKVQSDDIRGDFVPDRHSATCYMKFCIIPFNLKET